MSIHVGKLGTVRLALIGAAFLGLAVSGADAQGRFFCWPRQEVCPADPNCATTPDAARATTTPGAPEDVPTPGPITSAALGGALESFGPGYLDNPVPYTHFRLRFDSVYDDNRPDRAEFLYPQCGCSGMSPHGVPILEKRIDYQDLRGYLEYAPNDWLSAFVEVPYRFLNPELNSNASGLADMNTGFKVALLRDAKSILTFQGRVYIPTGDSSQGLGNDHVSLEPSLLYAKSLTEKLVFFGQLEYWIPIGGTDFAGSIINYGAGVSYTVLDNGRFRVSPVLEFLGWTVLSGKEFVFPSGTLENAAGDTIVNAKFGVRLGFGSDWNSKLVNNSELYIGYGRALTGDVWYKDILRVEYQLRF